MIVIGSQTLASLVAHGSFFRLVESSCRVPVYVIGGSRYQPRSCVIKRWMVFATTVAFSACKCSSRENLVCARNEAPTKTDWSNWRIWGRKFCGLWTRQLIEDHIRLIGDFGIHSCVAKFSVLMYVYLHASIPTSSADVHVNVVAAHCTENWCNSTWNRLVCIRLTS